ncbi:MAG: polyphosphate kinase 2 family protein [Phycisphaerales bacterium]|nr:polyphosphate kinase 2 family protein [Phycisphaerales bacterium]
MMTSAMEQFGQRDQPVVVPPGTSVKLSEFDPRYCPEGLDKKTAAKRLKRNSKALADLGYRLYGEDRRALLLVLQGMDTSGKDGTIRSMMRGFNPQGCTVTSFRVPSDEERDHDFLWRIHRAVPRRGNIGIFNRSHYEDVLVVKVRELVPASQIPPRYGRINEFERMLDEGGVTIVKCFLHIGKDEQRERLQARIDNPNKRWKFSMGDIAERKLWDDYQRAYEDALTTCNTAHAPWHIIPADRKWYRNMLVSEILVDTLLRMNPTFPPASGELDGLIVE